MPPPLFTQLEGRFPIFAHEHVAVIYRERAAAFRQASFLAEGLKRGDLCHYLAPQTFHAEMLKGLRAFQLESSPLVQSQTLRVHAGLSDFGALRNYTQQVFANAERAGVPAVRWLEEGSWPQSVKFPAQQFFEFHAVLNYQVKHYPSVALCQYSLDQIEPGRLFSAIATHRHLLIGETLVRDNPFYIPAERFIPLNPSERHRDLMSAFREVGFDVEKLLVAIAAYGRLHPESSQDA
jgi:hypothetical protein